MAHRYICVCPFPCRAALVCRRDVHAFRFWSRSRTLPRPACLRGSLFSPAHSAFTAADHLGSLAANRAGWLARVAFWNFCCVCSNLSARRVAASNHGQMVRAHSGRYLHVATNRLSRVDRSGRRLDEHCRCVPLR